MRGDCLTVEVTETAILEDVEQARMVLSAIDQMGIDISVDDFGTGHASISRLHALPVSEVKIDRSFVSGTGARSRSYLAAIVAFGRNLDLRVVAEGVEDDDTLTFLSTLDCDVAQGYLISRPLDADAMTRWITTARTSRWIGAPTALSHPGFEGAPPGRTADVPQAAPGFVADLPSTSTTSSEVRAPSSEAPGKPSRARPRSD
jgi:predicted signal transduction protein with EAL and GGDEF domain